MCKPEIGCEGAASEAHYPDELTDPGPAEAEAEREFATQGTGVIDGDTLFVDEMPTAADGSGRRREEGGGLDDRVHADRSATGDETRSGGRIFEDAASHQISDAGNSSVDSIRAEKQENGRAYYFIHGTVTVKMNPYGSRRRI